MNEQNKNNPPPSEPEDRFALDLDIDVDLDLPDEPAAPPPNKGALAPSPRRASSRPRYQAARQAPPPPRYQRGATSASPRIPTPSNLNALSGGAEELPSGDLAQAFASGNPLAFGVELSPEELPAAPAADFDPWADDDWGDEPAAATSPAAVPAGSEGVDSGLAELASLGFESHDQSQEPPSAVESFNPDNPFADLMDEDGEFVAEGAPARRRASPNSRPTLNFPQMGQAPPPEEADETVRLSPDQAQALLHHAQSPTQELARQADSPPEDALENYGQQLFDLGSGFDSFDLSDLAPPEPGAPNQPPELELSIELPWLSQDEGGGLHLRAQEAVTFDRREHTLPIDAPDLEHVSSGAVEVELLPSEPDPPLQPPLPGGTESGGFGIVRRNPHGSEAGRPVRTPHPPARPLTGPTTRRASPTAVDPELTRKIERAQALRRGGLHEEARALLEEIMESDPNNSQARHLFQLNTEAMSQKFLTRLGNLEARPELAVNPGQLKGLGLDSRAGYLLTLIDGMSTYQDILEISPMPDEETAELLVYLLREGVIRSR